MSQGLHTRESLHRLPHECATRLHLERHAERRSHDRDVFAALVSIVALVIVAAIVVAPIAWVIVSALPL